MLIADLSAYLKPVNPRYLSKLHLFLEFLQYRTDDAYLRASHLIPNTYGYRLLTDIIKLADFDQLPIKEDLKTVIVPYLLGRLKDIEKPLDVRTGKTTTSSLFIKSSTYCYELMTAVRSLDNAHIPPLEAEYTDKRWSDVRPFRIIDMGTTDISLNVYSGYLTFSKHGPTHAIYGLDAFNLIVKFIAYYKYLNYPFDLDKAILKFLHNEIIVPTLLRDSLSLWLRNIYKQQFIATSPLDRYTSTIWDSITITNMGSDFKAAMDDVASLRGDLINQSVSVNLALSSLLMTTDHVNFIDYLSNLDLTTQNSPTQNYTWVSDIKILPWIEFIVMICSFTPNHPTSIGLQRVLLRHLNNQLMHRPWNMINASIPYKNIVINRINGLIDYLNTTLNKR